MSVLYSNISRQETVLTFTMVIIFVVLFVFGTLSNICLIIFIIKRKLYKEALHACVFNVALAAFLQVKIKKTIFSHLLIVQITNGFF